LSERKNNTYDTKEKKKVARYALGHKMADRPSG
jgi:hypothetical protein